MKTSKLLTLLMVGLVLLFGCISRSFKEDIAYMPDDDPETSLVSTVVEAETVV